MDKVKLSHEQAEQIAAGVSIDQLRMRDAETGHIFLEDPHWGAQQAQLGPDQEREVYFPKEMLNSKAISRMIIFSTVQAIEEMSLAQKMYLNGQLVETLFFQFGFVIPGSTNSWEQTIVADSGNVMPAEILSGNLTCETLLFSHGIPIHKSLYRIFYQ